ncbi:MAG: hypothetical protein DME25_00660 [Verrucomicrobia bacterium]|nr:MAG: hypothetical protein DME25_00660 [Verrucomicrobiota bacterium]
MTKTILFADDDPLMHLLYKHHVEQAGYQWIGAKNGREALEAAAQQEPQLAVMDVVMPEMDGLSALVELKKTEATKAMPVIVMTSDPSYAQRKREFTELGAAAFLTKPFSPAQLLEAVGRLV